MSHIMGITFRSMNISQLVIWFLYTAFLDGVWNVWLSEAAWLLGK